LFILSVTNPETKRKFGRKNDAKKAPIAENVDVMESM
jgi:hypothetical protein